MQPAYLPACSVLMRLLRRNPMAALDLHVPASSAEALALTSPASVRVLVCVSMCHISMHV